MRARVIFPKEGATSLQVYVAVITLFVKDTGALVCNNVIVLAENHTMASAEIARKWPEWDLQALTCVSDFHWFKAIILDENSPDAYVLRTFIVEDIEVVLDTQDDGHCYRRSSTSL